METIINNGAEGTFQSININIRFRAWLGHDNKYFDRTCSNAVCKGMYSSFEHQVCPKCGSALVFITTASGQPMGISEGTFYPVLTQKQKQRDLDRAMAKKGGVEKVYRFKMFSFGNNNLIAPPVAHAFCKKGALVEIHVVNHQSDSSIFMSNNNVAKVEEMYSIFEKYGDSVTFIEGVKVQDTTISYPVNADGSPAPVNAQLTADNTNTAQALANLAAQLEQIKAQVDAGAGAKPAVNQNVDNQAVVAAGEVDPFNGAV